MNLSNFHFTQKIKKKKKKIKKKKEKKGKAIGLDRLTQRLGVARRDEIACPLIACNLPAFF
jgi:hypothetical protein